MTQVTITVRGRVQGIFFRAETRQKALEMGLSGWVRNEDDGSVLICAQGPGEMLEKLVEWCRRGPPGAEVGEVSFDYAENPAVTLDGFEIAY